MANGSSYRVEKRLNNLRKVVDLGQGMDDFEANAAVCHWQATGVALHDGERVALRKVQPGQPEIEKKPPQSGLQQKKRNTSLVAILSVRPLSWATPDAMVERRRWCQCGRRRFVFMASSRHRRAVNGRLVTSVAWERHSCLSERTHLANGRRNQF